jgi:hypothetical protein
MANRTPDNRTVTQGVGNVKSDRSTANEEPVSSRSIRRRRELADEEMLSHSDGSERANIAGGAVTNDDGVSKGGR